MIKQRKVLVFGAGVIGAYITHVLIEAGNDVTILAREERAKSLNVGHGGLAPLFAKGLTPYPKWCAVFCMLIGIFDIVIMKVVGNQAWACALSTGWLSIGSMITFAGLLINMKKARNK